MQRVNWVQLEGICKVKLICYMVATLLSYLTIWFVGTCGCKVVGGKSWFGF